MFSLKEITLDDIELRVEASNWREAIRNCSRKPLIRGKITEKYVENMISSVEEFGPYIVLAENFALAHARPQEDISTGLFFTTLAKPVEFGSDEFDPVKLLVVLSATDSDGHLQLLIELAEILKDRQLVLDLCEAETEEVFLNLIKGAIDKN